MKLVSQNKTPGTPAANTPPSFGVLISRVGAIAKQLRNHVGPVAELAEEIQHNPDYPKDAPALEELETLLGAIELLAPVLSPLAALKKAVNSQLARCVIAHGEGKGATKTLKAANGTIVKSSPKTEYTITQEHFEEMVAEFPEDRRDVPFSVIRWEPALDKRTYNAAAQADRTILDKYLESKEGSPTLKIIFPGKEEDEE